MAKNQTPAKTPGVAIARVLRGLGLKQGLDFGVRGEWKNGERVGTRVAVFGRPANQLVADNANVIEQQTGDAGFPFNVSVYFTPSGNVWVHVGNYGEKTRQTHFLSATPAEPVTTVDTVEDAEAKMLRDRAVALADATSAQLTALRVIADNPGKVIAMVRGNREFLTINGNVENKLSSLGMIRARHAGTTVTNGKTHELKVWELTESGSDALSTEATPQHKQLAHADLSTEDGTVKLDGDELTRRGHWADVRLKDGRTYSVSMKVHRKGAEGPSTILVDHVIYWAERDGRSTGPIQIACVDDKPRSVGGRIWRLLLAANIA
jgi:hypothetical protein